MGTRKKKIAIVTGGNESTVVSPKWTAKHDAIVKKYEEEKPKEFVIIPRDEEARLKIAVEQINPQPSKGDNYKPFSDTKAEGLVQDEDWFPATKNKPVKPIQSLGDATFCSTCRSNTVYKGLCSVCSIKPEETRMKHEGNLKYLKVKYPHHVNVK
jgi:hypothetical protein